MHDAVDVKRKGSASVGLWVNYEPSTMTLTLDISGSNFEIAVSQEWLSDLKWKENKSGRYWGNCMTFPLYTSMTLALNFKLKIWNSFISGMRGLIGMGWKGWYSSWSFLTVTVTFGPPWWGGWMYRIVTGVTQDFGVTLTCHYVVGKCKSLKHYYIPRRATVVITNPLINIGYSPLPNRTPGRK